MGIFALYCNKCGLPFTPFHTVKYQQKTSWLNSACMYYDGHKVMLKEYDDYGHFTIVGNVPMSLKFSSAYTLKQVNFATPSKRSYNLQLAIIVYA